MADEEPFSHMDPGACPTDKTSVLVVGAGPAGATAARALARAGMAVTLLDRASFPRNKPCGGGISVRVLRRFPYLEPELSRIAAHAISRLHLEGPDGQSALIEADVPAALMVRRVEFDALLVSLALAAGARLVTGAEISHVRTERDRVVIAARDGRIFEGPIVIAADGVHSVIARRLGLNAGSPSRAVALDMMEETPREALRSADPATMWVGYGYAPGQVAASPEGSVPLSTARAPQGYAYVFPKRDHVNVGIGFVLSSFRETVKRRPYELHQEFVDALGARGVVIGHSVRENFTPFLIPIGGPLREPGRGRVLLAGDAGGFVNAFTAEGIYYAMVSGDLAARAIVRSKGSVKGLAQAYRRSCDREIGAELRDSVLIQRYLFADRRRIGRIVNGAHRHRAITRLIVDLAAGRRTYHQVRRRIFARAPRLLGHLGWQLLKSVRYSG